MIAGFYDTGPDSARVNTQSVIPPFLAAARKALRFVIPKGARALASPPGMTMGALVIASALILATPSTPYAHDIPTRVTVLAFIKPEPHRLRMVVRVPLESMRDVNFPMRDSTYLDIPRAEPMLADPAHTWIATYLEVYEGDRKLSGEQIVATRISLPSDRSFEEYDRAVATATGPKLPASTDISWKQAMLDVVIDYPITSERSLFSIRPELAHLGVRTNTVLRFLPPDGGERAFQYTGNPGFIRLDPRWYQAALNFVQMGFLHILDGIDHLLFNFCLVIPFRRIRPLIAVVTSFTVAHSITLIASAMGFAPSGLWFPPLIEVLIALSIVYMALENIVGPKLERRWLISFGFGLVHGFGFSFALRESMQFAGRHLITSLLSFNLGVELGQIFVLMLAIPALNFLFRHVVEERMGTIILSAIVAHTAWHWMIDRWAAFRQYTVDLGPIDASFLVTAMRGAIAVLVLVGALWLLSSIFGRWTARATDSGPS